MSFRGETISAVAAVPLDNGFENNNKMIDFA